MYAVAVRVVDAHMAHMLASAVDDEIESSSKQVRDKLSCCVVAIMFRYNHGRNFS